MEKYLWRFHWDCGRSGDLNGLFVATETEVNNVIGKEAWFGEVLGKHSEVYGTLEANDIKKLDVKPESIEDVSKYLGSTWSGFNPLHYVNVECKVCGSEDRAGEMYWVNEEYRCWSCKSK